MIAAEAASSKKAFDIVILDIGAQLGITDYFVIASGNTERQVGTIVDEVVRKLHERGIKPYRREGEEEKLWVLLDYLDFVVHVFRQPERQFYELERLWKDAAKVVFEQSDSSEEAG